MPDAGNGEGWNRVGVCGNLMNMGSERMDMTASAACAAAAAAAGIAERMRMGTDRMSVARNRMIVGVVIHLAVLVIVGQACETSNGFGVTHIFFTPYGINRVRAGCQCSRTAGRS